MSLFSKGKVCLPHHDLLNCRIDLFKKNVFRISELMATSFLINSSQKLAGIE
jgi:hypothetical protein